MNPFKRRVVASTIVWTAAIFGALIGMTSRELPAREKPATSTVSEDFVYFPGQYVNKATEQSEHIQTF